MDHVRGHAARDDGGGKGLAKLLGKAEDFFGVRFHRENGNQKSLVFFRHLFAKAANAEGDVVGVTDDTGKLQHKEIPLGKCSLFGSRVAINKIIIHNYTIYSGENHFLFD